MGECSVPIVKTKQRPCMTVRPAAARLGSDRLAAAFRSRHDFKAARLRLHVEVGFDAATPR
jgi:hypothetical protein